MSPANIEPAVPTEQFLMLGGPLNGEERWIPADAQTWVYLKDAQTYYRRGFLHAIKHPVLGTPTSGFKRDAFVHESIAANMQQAMGVLAGHLIGKWVKESGTEVPVQVQMQATPPDAAPNGKDPRP